MLNKEQINSITNTSGNDDNVTTDGVTASSIYSVFKPLMDPSSILTFDGKPYDESIKLNEYPLITKAGATSGGSYTEPDKPTIWFVYDRKGKIQLISKTEVRYVDKFDFGSVPSKV